jgi:hypothetical protein
LVVNDHPWIVFNAVIAGAAVAFYIIREFIVPWLHGAALKARAGDFCFNIPSIKKFETIYVQQTIDDRHSE